MFKRWLLLCLLFAGTCLWAACSYSLGGRGKLPFSTIMIAPVKNMTDLPQTQATLARNLFDSLNAEPGLSVVSVGGQAVLEVVVSKVKRSMSLTNSQDTGMASSTTLTVTFLCSLRDVRTGKYYFRDRSTSVSAENYLGGQSGLLMTQTFPQISRDAARQIKDLIVSVW